MAIDTRDKRLSMIGFGQVYITTLPTPDGSLPKADRPMLLHLYQGISLAESVFYTVNIVMRLAESTRIMALGAVSRVMGVR